MAVGAEQSKVSLSGVTRVAVDVFDIDGDPSGFRMTFSPATPCAPLTKLLSKVTPYVVGDR
jgi:flagellar basal body rod protein FlgC